MPIPKTTDVGKILRFLKKDRPNMSKKMRLTMALKHVKQETEDLTGKARIQAINEIKKK